ncbi:MAG: hypothetical protein R3346_03015 [Candidatus Spechtbacterales bacterium]|nr:hypothetical protein [Candidatus Spechtbacterales bacterium]
MFNEPEKKFSIQREDSKEERPKHPKERIEEKDTKELEEKFAYLKPLADIISGTAGISMRLDSSADTFYFDSKKREIVISPTLIEEADLDDEEQLFSFAHELGHFTQALQDPDAYLSTFEYAKEKASDVSNPALRKSIQDAWSLYFNTFLDVHSNSIVERRTVSLQKTKEDGDLPRHALYKKLFPSPDLTKNPLNVQFIYGALRKAMLPEEDIVVDPSVESALSSPFSYFGKEYASLQEFIDKEFFNPDVPLPILLARMQRTVEPIFEQFLEKDIEEGKQNPQDLKPQEGGGSGNSLDPTDDMPEPCHSRTDAFKDAAKKIKEDKAPASEKSKKEAKKRFEEEQKSVGFSESEIKKMEQIMRNANEIYRDLVDLWEAFLQVSVKMEAVEESGFFSGRNISAKEITKQLPLLLAEPENLRAFTRRFSQEAQETLEPKKISLYLVLDLSGSMSREKRLATQEAAYAVGKSLIQFRRNTEVKQGATPIDINLRVLGFGDSTEDLLPPRPEEEKERSLSTDAGEGIDQRFWKAILEIGVKDLSGTQDAEALEIVLKDLNSAQAKDSLEDNEEIAIVLEITDGDTMTAMDSSKIIKELNKTKSVFARGIQIPGLGYSETPVKDDTKEKELPPELISPSGTFSEVWGEDGLRLDDIRTLKKVMLTLLADAINRNKD